MPLCFHHTQRIRVFPYSGIQFMVFDRCKHYFLKEHEHGRYYGGQDAVVKKEEDATADARKSRKWGLTPIESLIGGMIAGSVSMLCTYPLDLTRAQLAVLKKHRHGPNLGFAGVLAQNYRDRGVVGLYRGVAPTLIGILPYAGIAFSMNEQGKRKIQNMTGREPTTIERMQCGALSGLIAQSVTYPIEVTRRRMQTIGLVGSDTALTSLGEPQPHGTNKPPSLFSTVQVLYKEQGIRGFVKGVSMNWMKGPVAFSISFTTFDIVQGLMESPKERRQRSPRKFLTKVRRDNS
jgi:hypothetical protein